MSSIGSGPVISSGPQALGEIRKVGAADVRAVPTPAAQTPAALSQPSPAAQAASAQTSAAMVTATARDAGPIPVDGDRVKVIKKAIDAGTYPVVPAKISDAMIAAGMLLRKKP